jgi:hypothetical protein
MEYNILVFHPITKKHYFVKVKGYLIESVLAPDVKFFAHRPIVNNKDIDGKLFWNISEFESGLSLVQFCDGTKLQTLQAMEARLFHLETDIPAWINEQKSKSIKSYGVANK